MNAKKPYNWKRTIFIASFVIVPLTHFLVFYVYVNFNSFFMAFQERVNGKTVWSFNTMKRVFERLFPLDDEMKEIFKNTFLTFGINFVMYFIGIFVSYFLYKKIFLHSAFRVLFFLPSILPGVMLCNVYMELIGVNGALAAWVAKISGLAEPPEFLASPKYANAAVLINMVWLTFPGNLLIWGGTFSRISDSVLEAAKLDGVNWLQEAFKIIIPMVWPTFSLLLVMMFAGIFASSGQVFLLTGGNYGTQTLSSWMYIQVYATTIDPRSNLFNFMSALGLIITAVSSVIAISLRKISSKAFEGVEY